MCGVPVRREWVLAKQTPDFPVFGYLVSEGGHERVRSVVHHKKDVLQLDFYIGQYQGHIVLSCTFCCQEAADSFVLPWGAEEVR